ncbi:DNA mismatch repair endonuclease MutL [Prevotella salivae]|uniref:DNA mismatch repair protein MutL n=2 Tax=Segatella salivae TaxID=228604 RepID=A0AAW4NRX8_9BACT|nr:DNA mismatch repair endonuclease MutL [Segatella salivae]EFV03852.1 DNA mismatch repair domain protein [Segatella salivae DSM 15606]MBW4866644.1 DNA mismatch repair endonuclease MutL [Segatella salivae]MBW4910552.1 DNA mismatch repair endonuclease MutL [Segatella salivae]
MSDIIQLLPDSVANQIAAGEVIQRPASVIKELVENSVDAGAKNIQIQVIDAGKTTILVTDDGKGMSATDARLSFERHATSKIRKADDLFALHTMGFRGEALASIAAVAQIELKTRQESDEVGTLLSISGSRFVGQEPCSCAVGSSFSVNNLFYNVPARRKFLKSNSTELNNIITAFERIALVYPDIAFTLQSNGTELFNLKAGVLRQRIIDIFGKRLNQELLSVKVDTTMCRINGYVGKPESARKKGAHQYFFVNGRYMKHPYFNKAVMAAFERLVPTGEQVPYFLYFEVAPKDIDVNIHPTKTEIKFENEVPIWQILSAAVKEAVSMFNDIPSIDFDTEGRPEIPVYNPTKNVEVPKVKYNPDYNPFRNSSEAPRSSSPSNRWEELYQNLQKPSQETELFSSKMTLPDIQEEEEPTENVIEEKSPSHYQYKGRYIMTAVKSGLMIIDQHRAHVRILFDRYQEQLKRSEAAAQKLLFPENLHCTASEEVTLSKILPELQDLGFEISPLGGSTYAILAVPSGLEGLDMINLLRDMILSAQEKPTNLREEISRELALTMARKAAIPQGQVLNNAEMENIFNSLFSSSNPNYTPDGKNILCILKQNEIEHLLD